MAKKNKTSYTGVSVIDFINSYVENDEKKADSFRLVELMAKWSGFEPKMWGPTIVGFGNYHYQYASGHEGDAPIIGFAPRKPEFSLYVYAPTKESEKLVKSLGKFKMGKSCIYVKRLSDINLPVLEKLCRASLAYVKERYEIKNV